MSKKTAEDEADDDVVQHERDAEDEELDSLEDGSRITEEHEARARDPKGRFVSEGEEEEEEEQAEAEDKPAKKKPAVKDKEDSENEETEEAEETEETEEAEETEETESSNKKPDPQEQGRMARRMQKLARERDDERRERARLEADLALERAKSKQATQKSELESINETQDKLYEEVEKARSDADIATAAKLQRQIDANNRRIVELETLPKQRAAVQQATEAERFNTLLDVSQKLIPELDPESEDFDKEAAQEVEFQISAYERMGMPSAKALRRALILLYQVDPTNPTKKAARKPEAEEEEEEEQTERPAKKKPTNVARNIDASKRQARKPERSGGGEFSDDGKIDVFKLTDEEFDALPESKLDELGGSKIKAKLVR